MLRNARRAGLGPWALILASLLAAGLATGGCPRESDTSIPGGGNPTGTPGGSQGGGSTGNSDDLAQRFPTCRETAQEDSFRAEVLFLVNRERRQRGLEPLVRNPLLEAQATQYACEMIHFDFFDHHNPVTGSDLPDRAEEFGYDFRVIGENLAAGQRSPAEVMNDWMNSPGHAANVLDARFTEIGIGVREGGDFGIYWVQEFGLPLEPARVTLP